MLEFSIIIIILFIIRLSLRVKNGEWWKLIKDMIEVAIYSIISMILLNSYPIVLVVIVLLIGIPTIILGVMLLVVIASDFISNL